MDENLGGDGFLPSGGVVNKALTSPEGNLGPLEKMWSKHAHAGMHVIWSSMLKSPEGTDV